MSTVKEPTSVPAAGVNRSVAVAIPPRADDGLSIEITDIAGVAVGVGIGVGVDVGVGVTMGPQVWPTAMAPWLTASGVHWLLLVSTSTALVSRSVYCPVGVFAAT